MRHQKTRVNMPQPNFFTAGSPYLNHPQLTPERTAQEIDFILSEIDIPACGHILDVGCGPGRHSIELAQRGYRVVGIDPSATMINAALSRASAAGVPPSFQQVAGEDFVSDTTFDVAICLFTTLGQIEDQEDNRQLVSQVAKYLKPEGFLVVEVPQRDWLAANLKPNDRFGADDHYTDIVRQLNIVGDTVTEVFTLVSPDDKQLYVLRYRLYSPAELRTLFEDAGLEIVAIFGGYDKSPLTPESPVMLAIAQNNGRADQ